MKKVLLLVFVISFIFQTKGYDKLSLVERFTNASCVPCAQINNSWYNTTTQQLLNSGSISHLIYNGWWPGAGDPMYLLNQTDNTARINYYGVNAVPWIDVNGTTIGVAQSTLINAVNNGNSQFSPFKIVISQGAISNNLIEIGVKIIRDPGDVTTFGNVKLRVALTEKMIHYNSPPGGNGERDFFSVCRKMMPNAGGTTFTIPAPGDSIMVELQYVPTAAFLQSVIMDSLRVVAFIQDDVNKLIYQSAMQEVNQNYLATITSSDEYFFGASSETAVFTSYIKNIGLFPDTYNIGLDYNGPAGWSVTFTTVNGTFNYGETDAVILNPGDSTEVQANVNANSLNGYGRTTVQFLSNQGSFGNVEFRFTTFGLDVLVVDDDAGEDYENYFGNELESMNSVYGIIPSDFIPANVGIINSFNIIVWNTGTTAPGISTQEMDILKTFLDNGGRLYLNGVDIPYQMADPSSPFYSTETNAFFTNYLHASYILREHPTTITQGIAGDPITGEINTLRLTGGTGANTINPSQGRYANQIAAADINAANILHYWLKPDEYPAIRSLYGTDSKVVFTSFGFETISDQSVRAQFASKVIEWLELPTSVKDPLSSGIPKTFELFQNYPNPFNPETSIKYSVPETSPVKISVYDLTGREVLVLVNQTKSTGIYEVSFDASSLASGVYIYRMISGDFSFAKKMSILK